MKEEKFCFGFEVKAVGDITNEATSQEFHIIEGFLSTDSLDQGDDIVETKAIIESVEEFGLPRFLHQHDGFSDMPLGTITELKEVSGGKIFIKAEVIKGITFNDDIVAKAKHGEYGGLSIGYRPLEVEFKGDARIITKLRLREGSLVVFPMNEEAVLTNVKSVEKMDTLKEIEEDLRAHNYSKKSAETIISKIKALSLGDQGGEGLGDQDSDEELEKKALEEQNEMNEMFAQFLENGLTITNEMKEVKDV